MNAAPWEAVTERPDKGEAARRAASEAARNVLGPLPCIGCRQLVVWLEMDGGWQLMQGSAAHRCHD